MFGARSDGDSGEGGCSGDVENSQFRVISPAGGLCWWLGGAGGREVCEETQE